MWTISATSPNTTTADEHLDAVLALDAVDVEAIKDAHFKVVLRDQLCGRNYNAKTIGKTRRGVRQTKLRLRQNFAHNRRAASKEPHGPQRDRGRNADLGISVDHDVDRLAFICENGEPFVEEYTLVSVASYLFENRNRQKGGQTAQGDTAPYKPISCSTYLPAALRTPRNMAENITPRPSGG